MDLTAQGDGQIELFQVGESGGQAAPNLEGARDLFDALGAGWEQGRAQTLASALFQEGEDEDLEAGELPPLPKTIMLIPAGKVVKARDGREFEVDRDEVIRDANENGADLFIDWDHAAFGFWLGSDGTGKVAPSAAWLDHTTIRKSGRGKNAAIVGDVKFWTPGGTESVQNREYRYISPAVIFSRDEEGRLIVGEKSKKPIAVRILNAALVNLPALRMPALASREPDTPQESKTMNQEAIALMLGLNKGASESQIMEAFDSLKTGVKDLDAALAAAKTKEADLFEKLGKTETKVEELETAHATETGKLGERIVELRLQVLSVRGIVTPAKLKDLQEEGTELCALGDKGAAIFDRKITKLETEGKPVVEPSGLDGKSAPVSGDSRRIRGLCRADVEKNAKKIDMELATYLKGNPDLQPLFEDQA